MTAITLVALVGPPPALACSFPEDSLFRSVQPHSGAVGLPTNVEVRVLLAGSCALAAAKKGAAPTLESETGEAVEVAVESVKEYDTFLYILRPLAPLAPQATYRVRDRFITGPVDAWECAGDLLRELPEVVASFTTGGGADTTAPSFAGLKTIEVHEDSCEQDGCCGPYYAEHLELGYEPAEDDLTPAKELRYHIYVAGQPEPLARYQAAPRASLPCGWSPWRGPQVPGGSPATLSLRAVDLAGNVDGNEATVTVAWDCLPEADPGPEVAEELGAEPVAEAGPEPVVEVGPEAEPDASGGEVAELDTEPVPDTPAPEAKGSGCAGGSASFGGLAFAVLALMRRRRR